MIEARAVAPLDLYRWLIDQRRAPIVVIVGDPTRLGMAIGVTAVPGRN